MGGIVFGVFNRSILLRLLRARSDTPKEPKREPLWVDEAGFITGRMPFVLPNRQHQSTEGGLFSEPSENLLDCPFRQTASGA